MFNTVDHYLALSVAHQQPTPQSLRSKDTAAPELRAASPSQPHLVSPTLAVDSTGGYGFAVRAPTKPKGPVKGERPPRPAEELGSAEDHPTRGRRADSLTAPPTTWATGLAEAAGAGPEPAGTVRAGRASSISEGAPPSNAAATTTTGTRRTSSFRETHAGGSSGLTWLANRMGALLGVGITDANGAAEAGGHMSVGQQLERRFRAGEPTFVACSTTEADDGYWLCRVVDMASHAAEAPILLKLAILEPDVEKSSRTLTRRLSSSASVLSLGSGPTVYVCTREAVDQAFFEVESDLVPVVMEALPLDPKRPDQERFRLLSDVKQLLERSHLSAGATVTAQVAPAAEPDADAVSNAADVMSLYEFDPEHASGINEVAVNLESQADVLAKCDHIVQSVAQEVSLIDFFPVDGGNTSPVQSPWHLLKMTEGVELYKKKSACPDFFCYLARAVVSASPSEIKYLLKHAKNREYFDPMCQETGIVQTIDESTSIVYFVNRKFMLARDFCVLRHDRTTADFVGAQTTLVIYAGSIRGLVLNSGFAMIARGKGECLMSYMTQVNMAGWLPVALAEYALEQQVVRVITRLRDHFRVHERYDVTMERGLSIQDDA